MRVLITGGGGFLGTKLAAALAANPQGVAARRNLDTLAVVIARRAGRWLLLAPVPALVAAASGYDLAARVLALLAVAGIPVAGVRWWRALSAGQRRAMRGLTRRVRPAAWAWPVGSAVVGGWALVRAGVWPEWVTMGQLVIYLLVMMTLIMVRAASSTPLRTRRARAARRSSDVGRVLGNG